VTARLDRLEDRVGALLATSDARVDLDDLRRTYGTDPVGFIRNVCGGEPWAAQVRIAELVRDHRQVVVRSCNGAGKDWLAGRLAVWAAAMGWLVLITGPTLRQVQHVVMGEAYRAWAQAKLPGDFYELAWRLDRADHSGILAFTSGDMNRLTGLHAPKVLAIITEAQGVPAYTFEAMLANLTGEISRLLVVGNPLSPSGPFYEACRSPNWTAVHIGAAEAIPAHIPGGITERFVASIAAEYGIGSGIYAARVEGQFPDESTDALCRRIWCVEAVRKWDTRELFDVHTPVIVGVDVARSLGGDETVAVVRRGGHVETIHAWRGADLMESTGKVVQIAQGAGLRPGRVRANGLDARPSKGVLAVDEIGVGGGLHDRLAELGFGTAAFNGGWKARRPHKYVNARSEAAWLLRVALEQGIVALPDDPKLVDELCAIRWRPDSAGRVALERKEVLRERIGRSCDRLDAVSMAWYQRPSEHIRPLHYST